MGAILWHRHWEPVPQLHCLVNQLWPGPPWRNTLPVLTLSALSTIYCQYPTANFGKIHDLFSHYSTSFLTPMSDVGRSVGCLVTHFLLLESKGTRSPIIKWTLGDKIDQISPPPLCKTCFSTSEWIWHTKKYLVNLQKFWDLGRPPPHVGKNSQIISFFLFDSVPNQ